MTFIPEEFAVYCEDCKGYTERTVHGVCSNCAGIAITPAMIDRTKVPGKLEEMGRVLDSVLEEGK